MIVLSQGRSGSTGVFQAISNLTGQSMFVTEYTGRSPDESDKFLTKHAHDEGEWLLDYLSKLQKQIPKAGVVGFKWKPFRQFSSYKGGVDALKLMSQTDPPVKVIYSYRNPLDVMISDAKHQASKFSIGWMCKRGDDKCVQEHQAYRVKLETKTLVNTLQKLHQQQVQLENLLEYHKVPHLKTTYESLFFNNGDAEPWMEIFRFLGVGPSEGLTMEMVQEAAGTADTSLHRHSDSLSNYAEVERVLKGSEFHDLLH